MENRREMVAKENILSFVGFTLNFKCDGRWKKLYIFYKFRWKS